ncbi:erythromycin esterase family protein [Tannerella forsythia]|uniref:erythromycin esterase family protein n=1 Tax=Tannerella forsythia TaxID=28112 RepID=UPI00242C7241|nr:erythromycin esterase family protein [Tannerella forsythia]
MTIKTRPVLIFLLFFLLLTQCHSCAQQSNNSLLTYNWVMSKNHPFLKSKIDSTTVPSILLETIGERAGICGFSKPLFQEKGFRSKASIKINYKIENGSELYLKLITIGNCEKIISIDTLYLSLNEEWTTEMLSVDIMEAAFLNLSIEAKGNTKNSAKIWINDLNLFINGKNIKELETADKGIKMSLQKEDITPVDDKNRNHLPFMSRKILAIGETVHGTETMNDIAIEIIKNRIIHHNCKLILLEIPFENSFYINRYIERDSNFKIDSISTYFDRSLFSSSFLSLIEWIKRHNSHSDKKVYFWGIDVNYIQLQSKLDLFKFFYTLNITEQDENLKKICELLVYTGPSLDEIIAIFDANKGFKNMLTEDESELMRHCLVLLNNKSDSYSNFINRDERMYQNTAFMFNHLLKPDETVTLFCHFGHVAYQGIIENTLSVESHNTLGYYMKNKYKDDYSCIALITGKGDFLTSTSDSRFHFKIKSLQSPTRGSLEYLMDERYEHSSFLSTEKMNCTDIFKTRYIGNMYIENQFKYMMPKARMDGAIFIKQVYPIKKKKIFGESELNTNVIIMNAFQEALKKIKNK